jgi:hypothetical protein
MAGYRAGTRESGFDGEWWLTHHRARAPTGACCLALDPHCYVFLEALLQVQLALAQSLVESKHDPMPASIGAQDALGRSETVQHDQIYFQLAMTPPSYVARDRGTELIDAALKISTRAAETEALGAARIPTP